jgi:hypothetical protein
VARCHCRRRRLRDRGLSIAGTASANVAVDNGSGYVGKGDVQSVLKWNNGDFDHNVGSLKFTAAVTSTYDNVLTCGANADNNVVHVPSPPRARAT